MMSPDPRALSSAELELHRFRVLLARITYKGWALVAKRDGERCYLQAQFYAPDHDTGTVAPRHGRKWLLSRHMTDSEVVATAFKACLTAEEHECREAFRYRGQPVFGPHIDVDWLADTMREQDVTDVRDAGERA